MLDEEFGAYAKNDVDFCPPELEQIIDEAIIKGQHSVLEHAGFTFSISGVSRVFTHQLVRHRIASYSQLSQHSSDTSTLDFVLPPDIRNDPDLNYECFCVNLTKDLDLKLTDDDNNLSSI